MTFETNTPDERLLIKQIIKQKQNEFSVILPPKYLTFIETFKVGIFLENKDIPFFLDRFLRPTPIIDFNISFKFKEEEYFFGHFLHLSELNNNHNEYLNKYNLIRIGDIIQPPGLFLGVGEGNQDKVYAIVWEENNGEPIEVCEDIFELVSMLKIFKNKPVNGLAKYSKECTDKYYKANDYEIKINSVNHLHTLFEELCKDIKSNFTIYKGNIYFSNKIKESIEQINLTSFDFYLSQIASELHESPVGYPKYDFFYIMPKIQINKILVYTLVDGNVFVFGNITWEDLI